MFEVVNERKNLKFFAGETQKWDSFSRSDQPGRTQWIYILGSDQ